MKIIKGETTEKQIEHIDTILKRLLRKTHKTAAGIISPYPISSYVQSPIGGVVLRYMFPAVGKITLGALFIETMPKSGVDICATIYLEDAHKSEVFFTKKVSVLIKPDIDVVAGSRLVLSVRTKDEEDVYGIWTSLLWVPEVKDSITKQFLIDELDKIEEENASEAREVCSKSEEEQS